jgi:flagellar biosynthesis GTPase FlhF
MSYDRICVTKTDETSATGTIYTVTRRAGRPLTWITDGPGVPDDIEDADAVAIGQRVVADLAAASRRALAS